MSFSGLPDDLIEGIARQVSSERDLNSLVRVNRRFYPLANEYLYSPEKTLTWPGLRDPLGWAAEHGRVETTPRRSSRSAKYGTLNVVQFLHERVRREAASPDLDSPSALISALKAPLLDACKDTEVEFCKTSHFGVAKFLIEGDADLEYRTDVGETPFHLVTRHGYLATTELLLKHGAKVDPVDVGGNTPLKHICHSGAVDVAELLLEHGADIEAMDEGSWTPLHTAACKGHCGVARLLLRKGADVNAPYSNGSTPLLVAVKCQQPKMAEMLIESWGQ